jgi:hypothetical protein
MVKIRIGADWSDPIRWLFTGYVESWTPAYPGGTISICTLECVDAFKYFGMIDIHTSGNRPQESSGTRIDAVLDAISWPAGERAIAVGDIDVAEIPIDASALAVMQQTARTEGGAFYMSGAGNVTFEDRSWRDTATSAGTWGSAPDGTENPYAEVSLRLDDSQIWNQIEATRIGGIKQTAYDTTSQTDYFVRTLTTPDLPYVDDAAALAAAELLLARYKDARTRLDHMSIDPAVRGSWDAVLAREISDMITVKRGTLYAGAITTLDAHIEAIEWQIQMQLWIVTWQLSPHFTTTPGAGTLNTLSNWKVPTLLNSWVDYGAGRPPAGYRREGDWVYLRGAVKDGTTAAHRIMTLPVGYRPPYDYVQIINSGGVAAQLLIQADGDVFAVGGSTTSVDLSGILFRVI